MERKDIALLVQSLTLEEKAGLTSGADSWCTKAVERLNIPAVRVSDGPHGLRMLLADSLSLLSEMSMEAVCFPAEAGMAASFNKELLYEIGEELGKEAQDANVQVILGPGVNIKRSPLCGRNFEYFSEDPYLSGELGAAYVNGVQSQGVGTSLKHFFANSQEYRRMDSSSELDERTMREIYLPAFETVVKKAQPWTIMASYNKVHGTYSTENKEAIDMLRNEWGYKGLVVSDWGATHDRVAAVKAGCDLTMPGEDSDDEIVLAVKEGRLNEADLDACCIRLLELAFKAAEQNVDGKGLDLKKGHVVSRKVTEETLVLLKNDDLLPLKKEQKVAFIGLFADKPRFQGGGSANINTKQVISALNAAKELGVNVCYAQGYREDGSTNDILLEEAVATAKAADAVVIFAGIHDEMETEGVDRRHMKMPDGHNAVIHAVCQVNPQAAVVLHNGGPLEMPWIEEPKAVLEAYLGGEAVGHVLVHTLYGLVNPSGHLPETFPIKLEDNPSYLSYHGEGNVVEYQEGIFVGYRYYTTKRMPVLFPFGYGLSYTKFSYSDLQVDKKTLTENETLTVTVRVKNDGDYAGKALVQVYVSPEHVDIIRPVRELKGFEKVELQPGESKIVSLELDMRAFAHWNTVHHQWKCEHGKYDIEICTDAATPVLTETILLDVPSLLPRGGFCNGVPMKVLAATEKGYQFIDQNIQYLIQGMIKAGYIPEHMLDMLDRIPGGLTLKTLEMLSQYAGSSGVGIGGARGMEALMQQPIQELHLFLPAEKKNELKSLLKELNKEMC